MNRQSLHVILFMTCFCLLLSEAVNARVSILTGSISLREGYDSNIYRTQNNEISGWTTTITPALELSSQGEDDTVSIGYAPGFSYDHKRKENEIDHRFFLRGDKDYSKDFHASLRETYIRSSNTFIESETLYIDGERLLREYNRRDRLWTNTVVVQTDYEYAKESFFTLSYANHILEHLTTTSLSSDDYMRHNPRAYLSYQINHMWGFAAFYSYIKGDFDVSEDLTSHNPGLRVNYRRTPLSTLFGSYALRDTSYTGILREDYRIHDVSLGIDHEINPATNISLSVGYSRVDMSVSKDEDDFNGSISLTKTTQRGSFNISGEGGLDESNFSGADNGLSWFSTAWGSIDYLLTETSNVDVFAGVRMEDYLDRTINNDEKAYYGGGGLSYNFARWFTLSLRYNYLQFEAEDPIRDDYVDHRFYVALGAAKELWRW
jgi:opacity protein-like surface antigen